MLSDTLNMQAVDYVAFSRYASPRVYDIVEDSVILSGTLRPRRGSEVESKDPEHLSSATLIQGVLAKIVCLLQRAVIAFKLVDRKRPVGQQQSHAFSRLAQLHVHVAIMPGELLPSILHHFGRQHEVAQKPVVALRQQHQHVHRTIFHLKVKCPVRRHSRIDSDLPAFARDKRSRPVFLQRITLRHVLQPWLSPYRPIFFCCLSLRERRYRYSQLLLFRGPRRNLPHRVHLQEPDRASRLHHRLFGGLRCFLRAVAHYFHQLARLRRQLAPTLAHWLQVRIHTLDGQRFALHTSDRRLRAAASDVLQALFIAEDLVQIPHRTRARIAFIRQLRPVRDAVLDLLLDHRRLIAQQDRVPIRLRHLALVGAQQLGRGRKQRLRFGEDRLVVKLIELVEPPRHLARQLDVRHLIFTHGHKIRPIYKDVGRLQQWIP